MDEEIQDGSEVLETPEETTVEETNAETTEESEISKEEIALLKEKAAKVEDLEKKNKQLFERIKKGSEKTQEDGLSNKDLLFLAKTDIHDEDLDDVLEWAKFKKISVKDAYESMKPTLSVKEELRKTAAATQTKGGARGTSKVSGEDLLVRAERGEDIKLDDESAAALFQARMARKFKKK